MTYLNLHINLDKLLIDISSSNTWIGANSNNPYLPTDTSVPTNNQASIDYGHGFGSWSGSEYYDTVTLSSSLVIPNQSIGVADTSSGFDTKEVDGMLGLGFVELTQGTVTNTYEVPTVIDNLYTQV